VELMITVAIVAILAALAFPSFQGTIRANRVATTTNEFTAFVSYARSEAMRNSRGSVLCASDDGASCGGAWSDGWLLFSDRDGSGDQSAGDQILRVSDAREGVDLTGAPASLRFDPRGRLVGGLQQMQLKPQSHAEPVKCVTVRASGQASVSQEACR
jgi:type IV fimbrial biogenesis protein FimT